MSRVANRGLSAIVGQWKQVKTPTTAAGSSKAATTAKVVVATTVALSFISFWRGAAIVLSDLASSMFYAGGIAEHAIGKSAAWFVLAVMIFSFAVRAVYIESCGMFVRGGVYVVVRDSMGPVMARLSVSALVFDYILTGPISVVSAGQYLGRLFNELMRSGASGRAASIRTLSPPSSRSSSRSISGGAISKVSTNPAARPCASCRSPPSWSSHPLIWCPVHDCARRAAGTYHPLPSLPICTSAKTRSGWFKGTFWPQIPFDRHDRSPSATRCSP